MKKAVCFLMMILFVVCSPLAVSAQTYEVEGTDMTITIDDSIWYVFTRDNLAGNPELDELGLDYDEFYRDMMDYNIYMDAMLFFEDGDYLDLMVVVGEENDYVNLSNYDDSVVLDSGAATFEGYAEKEDLAIFENDYKYIVAEYFDGDAYLIQYLTVVNGYAYSFRFLSDAPLTEEKREMAAEIMEDVRFDVDTTMKEKSVFLRTVSSVINKEIRMIALWGGILVLAIPAIIVITVVKNKEAKKNDLGNLQ